MTHKLLLLSGIALSSTAFATDLPARIQCLRPDSDYQLVLILKDAQLPAHLTAIGLKKGATVVFKVATQLYSEGPETITFNETPASVASKAVQLNLRTKIAKLFKFENADLKSGAEFSCRF